MKPKTVKTIDSYLNEQEIDVKHVQTDVPIEVHKRLTEIAFAHKSSLRMLLKAIIVKFIDTEAN